VILNLTPDDFRGLAALGITLTIETDPQNVAWQWPAQEEPE
jgi:hypothetical protein